jgi:hypothetical protein
MIGYLLAVTLLGGFTVGMAAAVRSGRPARCRCFGSRGTQIGTLQLGRNGFLLLAAATGLILRLAGADPMPAPATGIAVVLGALAAGSVVILDDLAFLFGNQRAAGGS